MAEYKLCKNGEHRTEGYVFSVTSKSDPMLLALKENIRRHNKFTREHLRDCRKQDVNHALAGMKYHQIQRVSLMGRGPRAEPARANGFSEYSFFQSLPHEYAEYFDVYVGLDCHNQHKFREQLEKDLTPGQQDAIKKADMEIQEFKWEKEKELRALGLHTRMQERANGTYYHEWIGKRAKDEDLTKFEEQIRESFRRREERDAELGKNQDDE